MSYGSVTSVRGNDGCYNSKLGLLDSKLMAHREPFAETVTAFEPPARRHVLIRSSSGGFLGTEDGAGIAVFDHVDDKAVWDEADDGFRHVVTGAHVTAEPGDSGTCRLRFEDAAVGVDGRAADEGALFTPGHGPERLPSEYLRAFREHGWVCLTGILAPDIVDELHRVSCTGPYADREYDRSRQPLCQTHALARQAVEPVSLWLLREYMGTNNIRLGHTPSFAILGKDDGERDVQGWHSDFPYLWGIGGRASGGGRIPVLPGDLVLGVQRNVCVSEFTKVGGATAFKLGSHALNSGPPEDWGTGNTYGQRGYRKEHGLPYNGPDADIVEAPPGSIILYDSRTWHRAGVNRTDVRRAAILQAMIPSYVMPFFDTSGAYKEFLASPVADQLDEHERGEFQELMVHKVGRMAITTDRELTELTRTASQPGSAY